MVVAWYKKLAKKAKAGAKGVVTSVSKSVEKAAEQAKGAGGAVGTTVVRRMRDAARAMNDAQEAVERAADRIEEEAGETATAAMRDAAREGARAARAAADRANAAARQAEDAAARATAEARRKLDAATAAARKAADAAQEMAEDAEALAQAIALELERNVGAAMAWTVQNLDKLRDWLTKHVADALMDECRPIKVETQRPGDPVYYVNGVLTSRAGAEREARALAERVDRPVWIVYNQSSDYGGTGSPFGHDFLEAIYDRTWPLQFPSLLALTRAAESGGAALQLNPATRQVTHLLYHGRKKKISIVSHSQGCLIVRNALFTASLLAGPEWPRRNLAWVATGAPLANDEVWPRPKKFRTHVNPGDYVAQLIGVQGGAGALDRTSLESHYFKPTYTREFTNPDPHLF